jgi:UDP-N-acetylmuramate--alanine ligase
MQLQNLQNIYFLGIGGIGMSGLARYFAARGINVSGYDKTSTELTDALEAEGIAVHFTDDPEWIPAETQLVVWTPAIPADLQELAYIKSKGWPLMKRAEVLGLISRGQRAMAVAGTHGKTTTSSILAHLMRVGETDTAAFLGGIAYNYGSNYLPGLGDWVVVEADEYDRSFLHLHPEVTCLMHLDADHLDIYGTAEEMQRTYSQFVGQTTAGGSLFYRDGLPLALPNALYESGVKIQTFGIETGDIQAKNLRVEDDAFVFDYVGQGVVIEGLHMMLPGNHNVENATAAISAALVAGVTPEKIREALLSFKGIRRRFEMLFRNEAMLYVDDYAHHPTELESAISAARMVRPGAQLIGLFQPHLFSRTRDFAEGFAAALDKLDQPWLLDIYPARELPMPGVSSQMLLDLMKNPNKRLVKKEEVMDLVSQVQTGVLMTVGAGDIENFRNPITEHFEKLFFDKQVGL